MYQITVSGRLPSDWEDWFEGFAVEAGASDDGPFTVMVGEVADQAALHGVLARLRDLAVPIISVTRISRTPRNTPQGT